MTMLADVSPLAAHPLWAMAATKKPSRRRESMGGLAKGLAVIRSFTRERASCEGGTGFRT